MQRLAAAWMVFVLVLVSGIGLAETAEDPYLLFGIPYGMAMEDAKEQLEEQLGVEFEISYDKPGTTSYLTAELPVSLYGVRATARYMFYRTYGMTCAELFFHGQEPPWTIDEKGNSKFNAPVIVEVESISQERFREDISSAMDELGRLYGIIVRAYGMPTGGNIYTMRRGTEYAEAYDYPFKDGRPDFEALKTVAESDKSLSLYTYWGDAKLSFFMRTKTPDEDREGYKVYASARLQKIWKDVFESVSEVKVGFKEENGPHPLLMDQ